MRSASRFKKGIALFLAVIHLAGEGFAQIQAVPAVTQIPVSADLNLETIQIPEAFGKISQNTERSSAKTLILVEDAHAIPDAQRSIQNILLSLRGEQRNFALLLEGVISEPNLAFEASFPDREWLSKKIEADVEAQNISGGAAAVILAQSMPIRAAEEGEGYFDSVRFYQEALKRQSVLLKRIERVEKIIQSSKEKIYSEEALQWDALLGQDIDRGLEQVSKKVRRDQLKFYPQLQAVQAAIRKEAFLNRPAVKLFWEKFLRRVESRSEASPIRLKMASLRADFRSGKHSLLKSAEQIGILFSEKEKSGWGQLEKNLFDFARQTALEWETIHATPLAGEYRSFIIRKLESLFTKSAQRLLLKQSLRADLLKKLVRMELSRQEWLRIQRINLRSSVWDVFKDFYTVQYRREESMREQIIKNFRNANAVVFVAGGFHREGLRRIAAEQNWNWAVVSPQITQIEGAARYAELMHGQVGWKSEIKVENKQADLRKAYWSYLTKEYAKENPDMVYDLLLRWRKNLILNLADQGQLVNMPQNAEWLHRWLAETAPEKVKQTLRSEWLKKIKAFQVQNLASTPASAMTQIPAHNPFGVIPAELVNQGPLLRSEHRDIESEPAQESMGNNQQEIRKIFDSVLKKIMKKPFRDIAFIEQKSSYGEIVDANSVLLVDMASFRSRLPEELRVHAGILIFQEIIDWVRSQHHLVKPRFYQPGAVQDDWSRPLTLILDDRLEHADRVRQGLGEENAYFWAPDLKTAMVAADQIPFEKIISDVDLLNKLEQRIWNAVVWRWFQFLSWLGFAESPRPESVQIDSFSPGKVQLRRGGFFFVDWLLKYSEKRPEKRPGKIILHSTGFEKVGTNITSDISKMQWLWGWLDPILGLSIKRKIPEYRKKGIIVQPKSVIFDQAHARSELRVVTEYLKKAKEGDPPLVVWVRLPQINSEVHGWVQLAFKPRKIVEFGEQPFTVEITYPYFENFFSDWKSFSGSVGIRVHSEKENTIYQFHDVYPSGALADPVYQLNKKHGVGGAVIKFLIAALAQDPQGIFENDGTRVYPLLLLYEKYLQNIQYFQITGVNPREIQSLAWENVRDFWKGQTSFSIELEYEQDVGHRWSDLKGKDWDGVLDALVQRGFATQSGLITPPDLVESGSDVITYESSASFTFAFQGKHWVLSSVNVPSGSLDSSWENLIGRPIYFDPIKSRVFVTTDSGLVQYIGRIRHINRYVYIRGKPAVGLSDLPEFDVLPYQTNQRSEARTHLVSRRSEQERMTELVLNQIQTDLIQNWIPGQFPEDYQALPVYENQNRLHYLLGDEVYAVEPGDVVLFKLKRGKAKDFENAGIRLTGNYVFRVQNKSFRYYGLKRDPTIRIQGRTQDSLGWWEQSELAKAGVTDISDYRQALDVPTEVFEINRKTIRAPGREDLLLSPDLFDFYVIRKTARSEIRQSLLNHPELGPKIRDELAGRTSFFMDRYTEKLKKPEHDMVGSKSWISSDDDKIALAVNDAAKKILSGNKYSAFSRYEIKQYRKAQRSDNPDYYKGAEVPFYLERRDYYGLSNNPSELATENPGLYQAAIREGYQWNEKRWARSEARNFLIEKVVQFFRQRKMARYEGWLTEYRSRLEIAEKELLKVSRSIFSALSVVTEDERLEEINTREIDYDYLTMQKNMLTAAANRTENPVNEDQANQKRQLDERRAKFEQEVEAVFELIFERRKLLFERESLAEAVAAHREAARALEDSAPAFAEMQAEIDEAEVAFNRKLRILLAAINQIEGRLEDVAGGELEWEDYVYLFFHPVHGKTLSQFMKLKREYKKLAGEPRVSRSEMRRGRFAWPTELTHHITYLIQRHLNTDGFTSDQVRDLGIPYVTSAILYNSRISQRGSWGGAGVRGRNNTYELVGPDLIDQPPMNREQIKLSIGGKRFQGNEDEVGIFLGRALHGAKSDAEAKRQNVLDTWRAFYATLDDVEKRVLVVFLQFFRQGRWRYQFDKKRLVYRGNWPTIEFVAAFLAIHPDQVQAALDGIQSKAIKFRDADHKRKLPIYPEATFLAADRKEGDSIKGGLSQLGMDQLSYMLGMPIGMPRYKFYYLSDFVVVPAIDNHRSEARKSTFIAPLNEEERGLLSYYATEINKIGSFPPALGTMLKIAMKKNFNIATLKAQKPWDYQERLLLKAGSNMTQKAMVTSFYELYSKIEPRPEPSQLQEYQAKLTEPELADLNQAVASLTDENGLIPREGSYSKSGSAFVRIIPEKDTNELVSNLGIDWKGKKVLVAPGYGDLPFALAAAGADVTAVDQSRLTVLFQKLKAWVGNRLLEFGPIIYPFSWKMALQHLLRRYDDRASESSASIPSVQFLEGDIFNLESILSENRFDFVVSPHFFETPNGAEGNKANLRALDELKKYLRPSGKIIIYPAYYDLDDFVNRYPDVEKEKIDQAFQTSRDFAHLLDGLSKDGWSVEKGPRIKLESIFSAGSFYQMNGQAAILAPLRSEMREDSIVFFLNFSKSTESEKQLRRYVAMVTGASFGTIQSVLNKMTEEELFKLTIAWAADYEVRVDKRALLKKEALRRSKAESGEAVNKRFMDNFANKSNFEFFLKAIGIEGLLIESFARKILEKFLKLNPSLKETLAQFLHDNLIETKDVEIAVGEELIDDEPGFGRGPMDAFFRNNVVPSIVSFLGKQGIDAGQRSVVLESDVDGVSYRAHHWNDLVQTRIVVPKKNAVLVALFLLLQKYSEPETEESSWLELFSLADKILQSNLDIDESSLNPLTVDWTAESLEQYLSERGIQNPKVDERFIRILKHALKINPKVNLLVFYKIYDKFRNPANKESEKNDSRSSGSRGEMASRSILLEEFNTVIYDSWGQLSHDKKVGGKNAFENSPFLDFLQNKLKIPDASISHNEFLGASAQHWHTLDFKRYLNVPEEYADFVDFYLHAELAVRKLLFSENDNIENEVLAGIRRLGVGPYHPEMGNKEAGFLAFTHLGLPFPAGIVLSEKLILSILDKSPKGASSYEHVLKRLLVGDAHSFSVRSNPRRSMPGVLTTISSTIELIPAIRDVASAWFTKRAQKFRRREGITDLYNLPVIIQAWVEGVVYRSIEGTPSSDDKYPQKRKADPTLPFYGAGVFSTRNPNTGGREIYGRYLENAHGEDLMTGGKAGNDIAELETSAPDVYAQLIDAAKKLEDYQGPREVEFVVNKGKVYFLQNRRINFSPQAEIDFLKEEMAAGRVTEARAVPKIEELQKRLGSRRILKVKEDASTELLAHGLASTAGAIRGRLIWDLDKPTEFIAKNEPVVFVVGRGNREKILESLFAYPQAGLITFDGNSSSHEAVLTRLAGIPSLINLQGAKLGKDGIELESGQVLSEGDWVVVDGDQNRLLIAEEDALEENGAMSDVSYGVDILKLREDYLGPFLDANGMVKPEFTIKKLEDLNEQADEKFKAAQAGADKKTAFIANLQKHFIHDLLTQKLREENVKRSEIRNGQTESLSQPAKNQIYLLQMLGLSESPRERDDGFEAWFAAGPDWEKLLQENEQALLEAQMAKDTERMAELARIQNELRPKVFFQNELKELAAVATSGDIAKAAPVIFYSPDIHDDLLALVRRLQVVFESNPQKLNVSIVFPGETELRKFEAGLENKQGIQFFKQDAEGLIRLRRIVESREWKNAVGIFFAPASFVAGLNEESRLRAIDAPGLLPRTVMPAVPKLIRYFAVTPEINAQTLLAGVPDFAPHMRYTANNGWTLLDSILETLVILPRTFQISA